MSETTDKRREEAEKWSASTYDWIRTDFQNGGKLRHIAVENIAAIKLRADERDAAVAECERLRGAMKKAADQLDFINKHFDKVPGIKQHMMMSHDILRAALKQGAS